MLSCDSGGGLYGLHLSMEVALICWRNEIDLVPLPSYMTRALMTLDRAPHREMEATWSHERHSYSARHGDVARTSFQFLPLLRTSWEAGVRESVISASFDECGLHPWAPEKLLCGEQAAELFRNGEPLDEGDTLAIEDFVSKSLCSMAPDSLGRLEKCATCKAPCATSHRFCPGCGSANSSFDELADVSLRPGPRAGWCRAQPVGFDVQEFKIYRKVNIYRIMWKYI